jgi:CheY-like chemotaxis protein
MTHIKSILLVDDDKDDQYFFYTALEEAAPGVELMAAGNGMEALEKLKFVKPDLILLDMVMPVMNGVDFLRQFRNDRASAEIPVIVYTGDLSIFQKQEVLKLGAYDVIIKAQDFPSTVEKIKQILQTNYWKASA